MPHVFVDPFDFTLVRVTPFVPQAAPCVTGAHALWGACALVLPFPSTCSVYTLPFTNEKHRRRCHCYRSKPK